MEIDKIFKPKKSLLITGLILVTIVIALFVTSFVIKKNELNGVQMHEYNDLISNYKDEENQYVKLVITDLPYLFATKTENNKKLNFYFAIDEYNYMYIVRLTDETYSKMENQYNSDKDNFKYILKGYIYNDPTELKKLAISSYNKNTGEDVEKITISNFRNYLGNTYLDETITPNGDIYLVFFALGTIFGSVTFIILVIYISQLLKIKSTLKKYNIEDIKEELSKIDISQYNKQSIYLTDQYIISTLNGLNILKYDDILWIYNQKRNRNGILIGIWVIACTSNKKRTSIATSRRDENILIEIISKIKEKNNNILLGFNSENKKSYKELTNK